MLVRALSKRPLIGDNFVALACNLDSGGSDTVNVINSQTSAGDQTWSTAPTGSHQSWWHTRSAPVAGTGREG